MLNVDGLIAKATGAEDGAMVESSSKVADSDESVPKQKEKGKKKLIALQYNYSDSDNEETREERKARLVSNNDHFF